MSEPVKIIKRDIAPGENFSHKGPVELQGNIGAGARVDIKDGGIHVTGSVGDKVSIETAGGGNSSSYSGHGIRISGNNIVMVNGKVISGDVSGGGDSGPSGITIDGSAGNDVALKTNASIEVKGAAGAGLNAYADGSITLADAGVDLKSRAGGSFTADNIGVRAQVTAGGSSHVQELGDGSRSTSGGSAHFEKIGSGCLVSGGGSAQAETLGDGSSLSGGGSARVEIAHTTATVSAGGSKKVRRVSAEDSDFALKPIAAPKEAAVPPANPSGGIGLKFKL